MDQKWWSQGSEGDDTAWLDDKTYHLQEKKNYMYVSLSRNL